MDSKRLFKEYHSKLFWEGMIKALICGFIVGFSASFIAALVTWLVNYNGLWISLGVGLGLALAATPVFYFKMFRPSTKKIAQRVDRLGLEERLITMMELEKDESYIAMRQREDAKEKLATVNRKQLKLSVFKIPIVALMVVGILSVSMTTVTALSAKGIIPGPGGGEEPEVPPVYIAVSYIVEEGGFIEGEADQLVIKGQDATTVVAVADEGYMFEYWSDEATDPERTDLNIQEELEIFAVFTKVEEGDGEGQGSGDPGDEPGDEPPEDGGDDAPPGDPGPGSGGKYEDHNQIIDGETYYRDVYQEYYDMAMEILAAGGEIPAELRAIIEAYFGIII